MSLIQQLKRFFVEFAILHFGWLGLVLQLNVMGIHKLVVISRGKKCIYTLPPKWYEQMLDGSLNFSVTLLVFEHFGMCFKNEFKDHYNT
jgi:hypothetical protein